MNRTRSLSLTDWFRCSIFWAFSLWFEEIFNNGELKVSMLNVLSFFFIQKQETKNNREISVSMLNFLSFFFIIGLIFMIRYSGAKSFDAQRFELFLYEKIKSICSISTFLKVWFFCFLIIFWTSFNILFFYLQKYFFKVYWCW